MNLVSPQVVYHVDRTRRRSASHSKFQPKLGLTSTSSLFSAVKSLRNELWDSSATLQIRRQHPHEAEHGFPIALRTSHVCRAELSRDGQEGFHPIP